MKMAFIGYGSMGKMLVDGFLRTGAARSAEVAVSNRSREKLACLAGSRPGLMIASDNRTAARGAAMVFLCVRPMDVKGIIDEIREELDEADSHVISIAACVTLDLLSGIRPGRYTKVIPSLASEAGYGVSLICHGAGVGPSEAAAVEGLFSSLGTVKRIREEDFEAGADLTSCAPGLLAIVFRQFAEAGVRHSGIGKEEAERMVISTLYGTAKLLLEGNMRLEEMIGRVATKGGITEEGVKALEAGLPAVFDQVFADTLAKHEKVKRMLRETFTSAGTTGPGRQA